MFSAERSDLPAVSIVATARNDNHGGDLLRRMRLFVTTLAGQAKEFGLNAELVIVDWNPPPDRPPLAEVFAPDLGESALPVRFVEVPPAVHRRFKHAEQLPLFQMLAKNAGVRRAGGRFVLTTNIDILFSGRLMRWLGAGRMRGGRLYRMDRYDVKSEVPLEASPAERLAWCEGNLLRVHRREGSLTFATGYYHKILEPYTLRRRWNEALIDWGLRPVLRRPQLHTNACGDFLLMAREDWFALRGFAELETFSMHLDSLFCFTAYVAGFREQVLKDPLCIYHIEHAAGSGFTPEGEKKMNERLAEAGIPRISDDEIEALALRMRRERRAFHSNGEDWGLAGEALKETVFGPKR